MSTFADRVHASILKSQSVLVAGCDPVLDALPSFILEAAERHASSDDDFIERSLDMFCEVFLEAVQGRVAAIKPNIAFFECYGLAGLNVFKRLCASIRSKDIPLIIDAKRGDIGSTAAAYSAAYLGSVKVRGRALTAFECDALTINPFLGFDTLEPFLADCRRHDKGVFVLVRTSNPGARDLQGVVSEGASVTEHVARWLALNAEQLAGTCGWSGLGAVVGASYPEEARALRAVLPTNYFLIPGLGAQGGTGSDAVAGFGVKNGVKGGGLVNVSRGLLVGEFASSEEFVAGVSKQVTHFNQQLQEAYGVQ
jgi:orotidine-5'-phosphate decarboxylase